MPLENAKASAARTSAKPPSTKSTSRYSLSSVGKALADVMNKEARDDKVVKKSRESTRRLSAIVQSSTVTRRDSLGERPAASKDGSPGATITRATRRQSAIKADATSPPVVTSRTTLTASPTPAAVARRASLRPRDPVNGSALPKYRPKSGLVEPSKKAPASPPRLGTRRRLSSSDEDVVKKTPPLRIPSPGEKAARPVSPLPRRASQNHLPPNVTIHISPSTPRSSKIKQPTQRTPSPTRQSPSKVSRTAKVVSPGASAIPRPPSSSSSSSSLRTPRTPQTPTQIKDLKSRMTSSPGAHGSPTRQPARKQPESPLAKHSKLTPAGRSPKAKMPMHSPSGSVFNEGSSIDSLEDVEFLLGSAISPGAPTPAVPRMRDMGHRRNPNGPLETPSRTSALPSRANLSYLSPMPPSSDHSPSIRVTRAGNDRGSLLSWDQLVSVGDMTLGEGEVENMIADITAPFSATASPAPSHMELDIPDSPSLSAFPSPAGYTSISQILLPDVTPSPAKFAQLTPERPVVDSSLVMMLRLQLASMENIAKERLRQVQTLENQLSSSKEARLREADELARQVTTLEEQMRASLETRERAEDEQAASVMHLEEELRQAAATREQAVQQAVRMASDGAMQLKMSGMQSVTRKWEAACAAQAAATEWGSVRSVAEAELDLLRSNHDTLNVLLAGLDESQRHLSTMVAA